MGIGNRRYRRPLLSRIKGYYPLNAIVNFQTIDSYSLMLIEKHDGESSWTDGAALKYESQHIPPAWLDRVGIYVDPKHYFPNYNRVALRVDGGKLEIIMT